MSALLPVFPEQRERWARERPDPVVLEMDASFTKTVVEPDQTFPNQRWITFTRGAERVEVMRCWDSPRNPGQPMATESEREIEVAGRKVKLVTTSVFDGVPRRVFVFWLTGEGYDVTYGVRVVLEGIAEEALPALLSRIKVAW